MKRLFYLLCLFVCFACDDNDDKVVADVDKPYSKMSSSELKNVLEENLTARDQLVDECNKASVKTNKELMTIARHYDFADFIDMNGGLQSAACAKAEEEVVKGVLLKWNRDKKDFDITANAEQCLVEIQVPSSLTDDSKNDLLVKVTNDKLNGKFEMFVYKNETLWFSHIVEADKENNLQTEVIVCPPYTMRTELAVRKQAAGGDIMLGKWAKVKYARVTCEKEGGFSYKGEMNLVEDDLSVLLDCGNVRFTGKFVGFTAFMPLLEELVEEGKVDMALMAELLRNNFRQNVVVFTDRNEKIGDWYFVFDEESRKERKFKCVFQDGEEYMGVWKLI